MKEYTIIFNDDTGLYEMENKSTRLLGNFLCDIARQEGVSTSCNSLKEQFYLIGAAGIKVNLLEQDGSKMVW